MTSAQELHHEVANLVSKYADYCDQGDWSGVVGLFADDAVFDAEAVYGRTMTGSVELKDFFESAPVAVGHHPTSFYCTDAADDSVSVRMKMIVIFKSALFSVDYAWTLRCVDGELRIARQSIALVGKASLAGGQRSSASAT